MSVIHTHRRPELGIRQLVLPVALLLAVGLILVRLWYLQVVLSDDLVARAATFQLKVLRPAPRGLVYDRNGALVAGVRSELVVLVQPNEAKTHPEILDRLANILAVPVETLQDRLKKETWRPYVPAPVFRGATVEAASRIVESSAALPGVFVETTPMRYYPDSLNFAHVLGYVWSANESDVARLKAMGLRAPQYVGKLGLEYAHEAQLTGTMGAERMEVDALSRPVRLAGRDGAIPGSQLILSLDKRYQKYVASLLEGRKGAAVALDPNTGEVLALASAPTFDAALFEGGISSADYRRLVEDPAKPFVNRAIREHYSPGSTFKIVTTLAATLAGKMDYGRTTYCPGYYQVGNRRVKCLGRHGAVSFGRAFEKSCNTYFIDLAMRAGLDKMREASFALGLGKPSGVDLVGELGGIVPTDAWIRRWRADGKWYPGDTANYAIGQGEIAVSPIQMARLVAAIANGGTLYTPHFVKAIRDPLLRDKVTPIIPRIASQVDAPAAYFERVRNAMVTVIETGTARSAQIAGVRWGGKTGSTETRRDRKTHSWFVGFAPADRPKIAVAVLVEDAGHGGEVAAPIARDMVRAYLLGLPAEFAASARPAKPSPNDDAAASAATAASVSPLAR